MKSGTSTNVGGPDVRLHAGAILLAALVTASGAHVLAQPAIYDLGSTIGQCFMFQPLDGSSRHVANAAECRVQSAPASTFKIPHALIALETKAVSGSAAPVTWDGSQQPFPSWERDHSLESSIGSSVLWFFRRTAATIGRDAMTTWLREFQYGDDTFDGDLTSFWVNGDLVISPEQQLDFLARLFRRQLPVSRASVDAVAAALVMPSDSITNAAGTHTFDIGWPSGTTLRAKTGNTRVKDEGVSWLVGQVESGGREYVFVARSRSTKPMGSTAGANVARHYLSRLASGPENNVAIIRYR